MRKHKFVIWDQLSIVAVAILSAIASLTGAGDISTDIGYLVFGLFLAWVMPDKGAFMRSVCEVQLWR